MGKRMRNYEIKLWARQLAEDAGAPQEARSVARAIRRRRLWKNFRKKN